jgi:hypothetical protein
MKKISVVMLALGIPLCFVSFAFFEWPTLPAAWFKLEIEAMIFWATGGYAIGLIMATIGWALQPRPSSG